MLNSDSDDKISCTPDIIDTANAATADSLPDKTKKIYEVCYRRFNDWCDTKFVKNITENVLLAYLKEKSEILKPSTLRSEYSMLKATLSIKNNVDIRHITRLFPFLNNNCKGYRPKKSKILPEKFDTFLIEAPDNKYLMIKIVAIFGIAGACRRDELQKLTLNDIIDMGSILTVRIPDSKINNPRSFVISGKIRSLYFVVLYRKYASLRPQSTSHTRFFIRYNSKCSVQSVGVNTFSKIPS